jgi:nodulation protein F
MQRLAGVKGDDNGMTPRQRALRRWRPEIIKLGKNRMADQLATDIIAKIKAHAEPGVEEITTKTELTALGIHSLELTEIIFDLEEQYGIEIEMNTVDAWSNLKNVGDMVEAVRALIAKKV